MPTYVARGGKTRAQITLRGVRESQTFDSKAAARTWATGREAEIMAGARGEIPDKTFGQLLARYRDEVTVTKRGTRSETTRLNRIVGTIDLKTGKPKEADPIALVDLKDLDSVAVAQWRDRRLKAVGASSVRREWNTLSHACTVAIGEWKWLRHNPFGKGQGVKRPGNAPHRKETFHDADIAALEAAAAGSDIHRRVLRVVHFGIETVMRAGEIVFLGDHPEQMDIVLRVARLPDGVTKNGQGRDVPLSKEAIRLWEEALADPVEGRGAWGLTSATLDVHYRNLRELGAKQRPQVERLNFHDTRHTAATRLAKKLTLLELAAMGGWTNPKELMTYYNPSASEMASRLD